MEKVHPGGVQVEIQKAQAGASVNVECNSVILFRATSSLAWQAMCWDKACFAVSFFCFPHAPLPFFPDEVVSFETVSNAIVVFLCTNLLGLLMVTFSLPCFAIHGLDSGELTKNSCTAPRTGVEECW